MEMNKIEICRVLADHFEEIEQYFSEAPIDFGDRKDGFEDLLIGILTIPEKDPTE